MRMAHALGPEKADEPMNDFIGSELRARRRRRHIHLMRACARVPGAPHGAEAKGADAPARRLRGLHKRWGGRCCFARA